jgi:hypothetical protein
VRVVFLDHQGRAQTGPVWENGEQGKLVRSLMGDAAPMPESMAMYNNTGNYRLSSKPEPEVRLWFASAVAGGIRPWWHHVGADHEDRRMFRTAPPLFQWHAAHERYLRDRRHLASVAVLYWQRNTDFFGRDEAAARCDAPARGLGQALVRGRIPYALLNADQLESVDLTRYRAILLPNIGALSEAHCRALRAYVAAGGGLVATGETSLYDEWGDRRPDFGLADLFGAHASGQVLAQRASAASTDARRGEPSYLRFVDAPPERPAPLRAGPSAAFQAGWDETAHLPFGGDLVLTRPLGQDERVALTYIPPFPTHPPEFASMTIERTSLPCLYLREQGGAERASGARASREQESDRQEGAGRVAYLPAAVDSLYWRSNQPDHGALLAGLVRWAARDDLPVRVQGPGVVDVHAYVQGGAQPQSGAGSTERAERVIVHLVNLTHANAWKAPVDELIRIGEQRVAVELPLGRRVAEARLLVAGEAAEVQPGEGRATAVVPGVLDHEVLVLELSTRL